MKKLFKKLALMVVALLTFSVGSNYTVKEVKAADSTYSYTFTATQFSSNGTKKLNGVEWIFSGTGGPYFGFDSQYGKGHQFGSSKKPYTSFTLTSEEFSNVKNIKINTSGASSTNAKLITKIGGTQVGSQISLTSSAKEYIFTPNNESTGEVQFSYTQTSKKAIYIKSITIEYSTGDSSDVEKTDEEKVNDVYNIFNSNWNSTLYSSSQVINLPLSDEVKTSYSVVGDSSVYSYADGKLTINPIAKLEEATLTAKFTCGDVTKEESIKLNSCLENSTLTLEEANSICSLFEHNTYTTAKYYIECDILEVYNTEYGNLYVSDDTVTEQFTVYGLYSSDGTVKYDAMDRKPISGDRVKLYGMLGRYNTTNQMKNAWLIEIIEETPSQPELSIEEQIMANKTTTSLSFDYSIPDSQVSKISDVNELKIGDQIIISGTYVSDDGTTEYALSTNQKTNNRAAVELDTNSISSDVQIITLEAGTKENTYSFNTGSGYLYAASSSSNHLKTETKKSDNSSWSLEFTTNDKGETILNIIAQGSNTRNLLQFNSAVTDGVLNPLFACYAVDKPQKTVSIYKLTTPSNGTSSFDNISLLFGANVDSSLFENYTSVTAGVKISVGEKTADKSIVLTKDSNGNYNTSVGLVLELFADGEVVTDETKERLKQNIEATVYFVVSDGNTTTTLELQSTLVSVESMVNTYITDSMYNTNETVLKHMAALKALKAYIEA